MAVELERIGWEDGTLVSNAKVNVQGTIYEVEPEQYSGSTPLSAENLKAMEDNTETAINKVDNKVTDIDAKYEPEAIFCNIPDELIMTQSQYTKVRSWALLKQVGGHSFTINNGIKIVGTDTKTVKITVRYAINGTADDLTYFFITKNDIRIQETWTIEGLKQPYRDTTAYAQAIVDVSDGDTITVEYYGNDTSKLLTYTTIIVEKIA